MPLVIADEILHAAGMSEQEAKVEIACRWCYAGFEVRVPRSTPGDLGVPADLDAGETEAITLAIELHADLVLMDERKGTEAARQLGWRRLACSACCWKRSGKA